MRITNNQMALLAIVFTLLSVIGNVIIYDRANVTGIATTSATLSICINRPPVLALSCDTDATVNVQYTCDVDASDQDNVITTGIQELTFSDDTDLFNINPSTGIIQFTPNSSQNGATTITITVEDNSTCANKVDSEVYNLTVSLVSCGDGSCNGAETCSTCETDCGACPAPSPAPGSGGGGGGGAAGESSQGCHVDSCKIDSKILRTKEKMIIWVCFGSLGLELRITEVRNQSLTLIIKNTKETAILPLDQPKLFDIDSNGLPDLSIKLVKVVGKDVWLFFEPATGSDIICKIPSKDVLVVEPQIIRISLKVGDSIEKQISLSNLATTSLAVQVQHTGLDNIISFYEDAFTLKSFQSKIFNVLFSADNNLTPDVYNGKIVFTAHDIQREIIVIVEVESKRILFDVKTYIPGQYKKVNPGQEILANIDLYNLQATGLANIKMIYHIKDTEGNIVVAAEEFITTADDVSFVKRLVLPRDIKLGDYIFSVAAKYKDSVAISSDVFTVTDEELLAPVDWQSRLLLIIIILVVSGLIFGILVYREHEKSKTPKERREDVRRKMLTDQKKKLIKSIKHEIRHLKKTNIDVKDEESIIKKY